MTKTRDQKRKICAIDTSDRPAKMVTGEKPLSDNCRAPSVGISGDAIPAPVWGRVMEYLYYTDVLKCLLVNRMISFEAPKYVKRLVVLKSCEVEYLPLVRNRRRFENVNRVDILCLVTKDQTTAGEVPLTNEDNILCIDVIDKIVPFLEVFSKLEYCVLGGLDQRKDLNRYVLTYYAEMCSGPRDHASHFRRLVKHFVVAFERGSLPQHLLLDGIFDGYDTKVFGCREDGGKCSLCLSVLRAFPLNNLLQLHRAWWNTSCYSNEEIDKWIRKRNWSQQCLVSASIRFSAREVIELERASVSLAHHEMFEENQARDPSHIYFLPSFKATRLLLMLELGVEFGMRGMIDTLQKTSKKLMFRSTLLNISDDLMGGFAMAKSTFDLFQKAECPLTEGDFIVVDDTSVPGLREVIDRKENAGNND